MLYVLIEMRKEKWRKEIKNFIRKDGNLRVFEKGWGN